VYDADGRVVLDPDQQVQETVRLLFATFARTGAAHATLKYFRTQGLLFPTRVAAGARKGELTWAPLCLGRAVSAPAQSLVRGRLRLRSRALSQAARWKVPP